jgi:hypothetical protein
MRSMAAICYLAVGITCVAVILGIVLGYASVWGWHEIGEYYAGFVCFGLILGSLASLPVMTLGLVVSERRAFSAVVLGSLAAGMMCGLVCRWICWSFVHIT